MHADVVIVLAALVLVPVALLLVVRRRHTVGEAGTDADAPRTQLHCAAPTPPPRTRRS
jgi:hypothetical protein